MYSHFFLKKKFKCKRIFFLLTINGGYDITLHRKCSSLKSCWFDINFQWDYDEKTKSSVPCEHTVVTQFEKQLFCIVNCSPLQNVASFCSDAESKLMNLLRRNLLLTPSLTKRCGLECPSPSCNSALYAEDKSLVSFW